jgi:uroporphyrinogen decarboxylase
MDLLQGKGITPDVEEFLSVVKRDKRPERVHFVELFLDDEVKEAIFTRFALSKDLEKSDSFYELRKEIRVHEFLGYDVFRLPVIQKDFFRMSYIDARDTTDIEGQHRGTREWTEEHGGPIQSWKDFESYPWPEVKDIDLRPLEWLEKNLPENMGCYDLTAHILEMITFLLGYETFCYKMVDEPDLVDALSEKIGQFYVDYTRTLCDFSCVPLAWGSDDMGFRTGTLASPAFLRAKVLPWHKQCAEAAHEKDKPYLLHNCGNIEAIMDDLIDEVGIDARHSFEDAITPVTEAFSKYGARIALLGGIDVDFLCRAGEREIRERVRETLDACMAGTGYCLGTGNTVANYIPLDNFLIMLDEGRKYSRKSGSTY